MRRVFCSFSIATIESGLSFSSEPLPTLEISAALNALAKEGCVPTIDELAALSPYQTRHLKRFGNYEIDFSAVPALISDDLTFALSPPSEPPVIDAVQEQ
jgi:hypothetical protein